MLLGRSLQFSTTESPELVLGRLSAVVLPSGAIAPLKPVRLNEWISQHAGKRFVGRVDGQSFKLGLLSTPGAKFQVRGSVVVIVGTLEGRSIRIVLRPPLFVSLFLVAFALVMAGGLALSFFGPLSSHPIQAALVLALLLPFVIVGVFFRREALLAELALRQVLLRS
jgi:hypothetical protein